MVPIPRQGLYHIPVKLSQKIFTLINGGGVENPKTFLEFNEAQPLPCILHLEMWKFPFCMNKLFCNILLFLKVCVSISVIERGKISPA
jgi:hypothetical protein